MYGCDQVISLALFLWKGCEPCFAQGPHILIGWGSTQGMSCSLGLYPTLERATLIERKHTFTESFTRNVVMQTGRSDVYHPLHSGGPCS